MTLEDILTALEFSMSDRLDEIGDDLLEAQGVEDVLTTYFSERDVRPELMEVIKLRGVMNNYLNLSLEDREGVEKFRLENPGYLEGTEEQRRLLKEVSANGIRFIREQRMVPSLLKFFDFFLENRIDGETFGSGYLQRNEKLKERFGSKPTNFYSIVRRNFDDSGNLSHLIDLAVLDRPEIKQYITKAGLLEVDGTRDLLSYFAFYLENRVAGEVFGPRYLRENEKLKERFGSKPRRLYNNARNNFHDSGKFDHLIDLAVLDRPEIKQYTTRVGLLELDGVRDLLSYFDFYLENRVTGETFGSRYFRVNEKLKERFGSQPKRLYENARNNFCDSGKFGHLINLAVLDRPDLKQYTTKVGLLELDGVRDLLSYFDFYLENRVTGKTFGSNYLVANKKLEEKFGSKPSNLYHNSRTHFGEKGDIEYLVRLASEDRPDILDHWRNGALKE